MDSLDPFDTLVNEMLEYLNSEPRRGDSKHSKFNQLNPDLRAIYPIWLVDAEVRNGGFNQYFYNSSGHYAEDAVIGFRHFSMPDHAELVVEAVKVIMNELPLQKALRVIGTLKAFSESYKFTKLNVLDRKYYQLPDALDKLRLIVNEHPERFQLRL